MFYTGSSFRDTYRGVPHVLWVPIVVWFFTLCLHLTSVLIESGRFDKQIAARAQSEEQRIIETMLERMAVAEKRKRSTSRLEDDSVMIYEEVAAIAHMEMEEHPRHAML